MMLHGSLLDVLGVGTLLLGPSGIGKSECALELLSRGSRLVADDAVEIRRCADGGLLGTAPECTRFFMEIRGLGIISVLDLFGADAVCEAVRIALVCRLAPRPGLLARDRLGLEWPRDEFAGVALPTLTLPARPGGSMATVVEVAVREYRRREEGVVAARRLDERVQQEMVQGG
jgi:HPr kinase/phosphorylase